MNRRTLAVAVAVPGLSLIWWPRLHPAPAPSLAVVSTCTDRLRVDTTDERTAFLRLHAQFRHCMDEGNSRYTRQQEETAIARALVNRTETP